MLLDEATKTKAARLIKEARAGSVPALIALFVLLNEHFKEAAKKLKLPGKSPSRSNVDFVQEALLGAYERFAMFRGNTFDELLKWIGGFIDKNYLVTSRNRRTRYSEEMRQKVWSALMFKKNLPTGNRIEKPFDALDDREQIERMEREFARLTPDEQNIIDLRAVRNLSYKDIGLGVKRSDEAVRKSYKRAIERLRKNLESDGQPSK